MTRPKWPNETYYPYPDDSEGQLLHLGSNGSDYWSVTETVVDGDNWGFSPEGGTDKVRWPIGILLTALIILIAMGNSFVVLAILIERQLRSFENFFFASLAVADLSIALFVLPLSLSVELSDGRWHFGRAACDFFIFIDVSCCTASILHLCTIGLNRYWSISSPLKNTPKQTNRRAFVMIVSVWLLSFVIASPPLFGWPKRTNSITIECTYDEDRLYVVCSALGSFYLPLIVMIIVYYKIYRLSKKGAEFRRSLSCKHEAKAKSYPSPRLLGVSNSHDPDLSDRSQGSTRHYIKSRSSCELVKVPTATAGRPLHVDRKRNKLWSLVCRAPTKRREKTSGMRLAEVKTAKTLGLIMTVFVVCWLPFFLLYAIKPFCPRCYIPVALDRSALWLGYANSLLNPIIYICCKPLFRRTFKKILLLDYCRLASRYTMHVQCCPAHRHRHHARRRRQRHDVDGDSSIAYQAEYGHLSANVPPEMLHEDDRICRVRPKTANGPSGQRSWTSPVMRDVARYSGSSSSPPSVDWSSFDGVIKRVPNACVTDIPKILASEDDCQDPQTIPEGFVPQTLATDQRWCNDTSSTLPRVEADLDGDSRAHHRPRPRTDLILNSDFSPRVRVLNRRSTWSEPVRLRQCDRCCSNQGPCSNTREDNNSSDCDQEFPPPSAAFGSSPPVVEGMQKASWCKELTVRPCGGFGLREITDDEFDQDTGRCTGLNETVL